jgi:DNA-binding CsgD family transcriptional regulator
MLDTPLQAQTDCVQGGIVLPLCDSQFPEDECNVSPSIKLFSPLIQTLNEVDYGLVLLYTDRRVMHANRVARQELTGSRLLALRSRHLQTTDKTHSATLENALAKAGEGKRQLITLTKPDISVTLACLPLTAPASTSLRGTSTLGVLLIFQRPRNACQLSISFFSRAHGLTPAEEAVLRSLCNGFNGSDIAAAHDVSESTVRTQIKALREKTQFHSIRDLVQHISTLPPMALNLPGKA